MKTILAVDDNPAGLRQIAALLGGDYDVLYAKSGALALQICEKEKPDLILLDVEMPEMNGFETIDRLKGDPALSRIPVIFLTGSRDEETEIRALKSGAMDFIVKPPVKEILLHRIELHLQYSAYQLSLENTAEELEDSIVISFAELVEYRDTNIGKHVLRTGKCVELLGRALLATGKFADQLTRADLDMMVRAAPFHDIGKIGISDTILLKPDVLTPEEYDEVKRHTVIGARVIEALSRRTPSMCYLECAKQIAEGHHERYDGKGYPYGLAGEEIPLCARIMAVANVYDACLTDRVYRRALCHEEACEIIREGSGTHFDPRIAEVFESICGQFAQLSDDYKHLPEYVGNEILP